MRWQQVAAGSKAQQYIVSSVIVMITALLCYAVSGYITYHIAALLLLVAVSVIATLYDIYPVMLAAALSAVILNFFFIPPLFTFHIKTAEDLLMLLVFFIIAIVNAVFTLKIRKEERKTREREERKNAIKLYNTLFNSLSHELKTPIATIIGAVDMLKENTLLPQQHRDTLLDQIDLAGLRLNRLVENLLSMSRLESGMLKINKDWCDANEMVHSILQKVHDPGNHSIIYNEDSRLPLFKFDIGLIEQAVYNIVQNALLHTPVNSMIKISIAHKDDNCIIEIKDNGNGFPDGTLHNIFTKFYRLPDSVTGGTGLGLSIAKGFVNAHGGTITASNNKEGGALFTLSFPAETNYLNNLKNE